MIRVENKSGNQSLPILNNLTYWIEFLFARMAESVDAGDLKSLSSNGVWVQVPLRVPQFDTIRKLVIR